MAGLGARERGVKLDINGTFFSPPEGRLRASRSASKDEGVRAFWVEHARRTRAVSAHIGRGQGDALHRQPLDPRRHEGRARRPGRVTDAAAEVGLWMQIFAAPFARGRARGRARGQAVRHRQRVASWSARHEFYLAVRGEARAAGHPGHRALPPHRERGGQDLRGAAVLRRAAAAHLPRRALGQRPRGDCSTTTSWRHARGGRPLGRAWDGCTSGLDFFDASINRLGRLDRGRPQRAQGHPGRRCSSRAAKLVAAEAVGGLLRRGCSCWSTPRPCRSARCGTITAAQAGVPSRPRCSAGSREYDAAVTRRRA